MENRREETIFCIIKSTEKHGITIVSDEWSGYSILPDNGDEQKCVCHKYNFVDQKFGFHTQSIEKSWLEETAWVQKCREEKQLL